MKTLQLGGKKLCIGIDCSSPCLNVELGNGMIGGGLVYLESCRSKILLSFYRCICYLEYETAGNSLVCEPPHPSMKRFVNGRWRRREGGREREREGKGEEEREQQRGT